MHPRVEELVRELRLLPHPEGGHYTEVFRSPRRVRPEGAATDRSALTTIHFLLAEGEVSRWHRLDADEVWHHCEGEGLELLLLDADSRIATRLPLGPGVAGGTRARIVPAGSWLAARPVGAYVLVGCTTGPGFDYDGLQLMKDEPATAAAVRERFPELADLI